MSRTEEEMRRQLQRAFEARNAPTRTRTLPDGTRIATRTAIEEPRRPRMAESLTDLADARRNAPQAIAGPPRPRNEREPAPAVPQRQPVVAQNLMDLTQARRDAPQAIAGPPQAPQPPAPDFGTPESRRAANPLPPEAPRFTPSPAPQGDLQTQPNALAPGLSNLRNLGGLNTERGARDPRPAGDLTAPAVGLADGMQAPTFEAPEVRLPQNAFEAGQAVRQGGETVAQTAQAVVAPVVEGARGAAQGLRNFAAGIMGTAPAQPEAPAQPAAPTQAAAGLAGTVMQGEATGGAPQAGTAIGQGVERVDGGGVSRWTMDGETVATGRTPTGGGGTLSVTGGIGSRDVPPEEWANMTTEQRRAANMAAYQRAFDAFDRMDATAAGRRGGTGEVVGTAPDMQQALADYAAGRVGGQGYNMVRNLLMRDGGRTLLREGVAEAAANRRTAMEEAGAAERTAMNVAAEAQGTTGPSLADQIALQRLRMDQAEFAQNTRQGLMESRQEQAQQFRENLGAALQQDTRLPEFVRARIAGPAQRIGQEYGVAPETVLDLFASAVETRTGEGGNAELMEIFNEGLDGDDDDRRAATEAWGAVVNDVEARIAQMVNRR